MKRPQKERGQVLVLIILAIVVIFGFVALAVDGGRFFAERRRAQNAADAAVMAAAFNGATGGDWRAAGIASSQVNGYNDTDPAENTGAIEDVRVFHPPVRGRYSVASETVIPSEYYQVIIRIQVPQVFSQIVFAGDLWVEVEAVARGTPQRGFPYGAALVATCRDCCDALWFAGDGEVIITGGNVISNSNADGSSSCYSVSRSGTSVVDIEGGSLIAGGDLYDNTKKDCKYNDGTIADPCLVVPDGDIYVDTPNPDNYDYSYEPSCKGLPTIATSKYNKNATLDPGIYTGGIIVSGDKTVVTLNPGMYCLGGDLSVTSGSIIGSNIMFYMSGGSVNISTANPVSLYAPTEEANCIADPDLAPDCWSGFLVYMPYENNGTVFMAGGGSTHYTGTIYAPGPPHSGYKCEFVGSQEDAMMNASIICYTVKISGSNGLAINYDDSLNAQSPGAIELTE